MNLAEAEYNELQRLRQSNAGLLAALKWATEYLDGWPRDSQQRHCLAAANKAIADSMLAERSK